MIAKLMVPALILLMCGPLQAQTPVATCLALDTARRPENPAGNDSLYYRESRTRIIGGAFSSSDLWSAVRGSSWYLNISHRSVAFPKRSGFSVGTATELGMDMTLPSEGSIPVAPYGQIGLEGRMSPLYLEGNFGLAVAAVAGGHTGAIVAIPYFHAAAGVFVETSGVPHGAGIGLEVGYIATFLPKPFWYAGMVVRMF